MVSAVISQAIITPIEDNPGLIPESMGQFATSSTDWRIIHTVNLAPYFDAAKRLAEQCNEAASKCGQMRNACSMEAFIAAHRQLEDTLRQQGRIIEMLEGHHAASKLRSTRSILPVIGKVSRFLFGTLDEEAETEIHQAIKAQGDDNRKLARVLAEQTEIVQSEFNSTEQRLQGIETMIRETLAQEDSSLAEHRIQRALQGLNEGITQYKLDTEILTEAILFAMQGVVHPKFMPPKIFETSAETIQNTVLDAKFPGEGVWTVAEVLRISELSVLIVDRQLIYRVSIPLLDKQEYELFKMTAMPIRQGVFNTTLFAYIWPRIQYAAIDSEHRTYTTILPEQMIDCKKMKDVTICKNIEPVRDLGSKADCEVRLAAKESLENLNQCNVKILHLKETYWAKLQANNRWIFATVAPEMLYTQCKSKEHTTIEIDGNGILELRPGCRAHTGDTRLVATKYLSYHSTSSIVESLELNITGLINDASKDEQHYNNIKNILSKYETKSQANEYSHKSLEVGIGLQHVIEEAREISEHENKSWVKDSVQHTMSTTAVIVAGLSIIILVTWIVRNRHRRRVRNAQPTVTPITTLPLSLITSPQETTPIRLVPANARA